jgi:DNA repair exonuclease SbcCD nuclease subunit
MTSFRFLHAADIHLDSPLRGLEADPGAPAQLIRNATRRALGNLIDLALAEDVAFVLIAGDVYDGDWPDYGTGLFFMNEAVRLTRAGKPVFVIRGNHDAANRMSRSLRPPEGMTIFDAARPATLQLDDLGVAVHGQSFADQAVTENLAKFYPPPVAGMLNIGLLHTSADGRPGHAAYAPCQVSDLRTHGYDYWALGHIHAREVLCEAPWIVFPGNLQGRHANEPGAKGASLVTVSDGRIASVEHRVLDTFRWARVAVDLSAADSLDAALSIVRDRLAAALQDADGRHLGVRLALIGATTLHATLARDSGLREQVLNEARQIDPQRLWIEAVRLRTRPILDLAALRVRGDALGDLIRQIDTLTAEPPDDLLDGWPSQLADKLAGAPLPDDLALRSGDRAEFLARARDLMLAALAGDD